VKDLENKVIWGTLDVCWPS